MRTGFNTSTELRICEPLLQALLRPTLTDFRALPAVIGTKLCHTGQGHRDNFESEPVASRLAEARRVGDARTLRFFGDAAGLTSVHEQEEAMTRRLLADEAGARL